MGSVEPLKKLHARWGDQVQFVDVLVRQAHPGPGVRAYRSLDKKMADAQRYQQEDGIPWPVVVDDLQGTVHQVYGGLADPTYLIDADGRVAYSNLWTHVPTLHTAIATLLAQGGRGVVDSGWDRAPHLGPAMTDGWRGIQRGLPQSFIDLMMAAPGSATSLWFGHQLRPVLAPVTLRDRPLTRSAQIGLAAAIMALIALAVRQRRRTSPTPAT